MTIMAINQAKSLHKVRSFVRRSGRLTLSQRRAIECLWAQFCLDNNKSALDLPLLFERHAKIILEIGFGNGKALIEMAKNAPQNDFIGVEVHLPGVGQMLREIEKQGLTNIKLACVDAVELLRLNIAGHALDGLHIYFPDPWHKKRHHKRRLIQPPFITLIARKIKRGGYVHIATDWQDYAENILADFNSSDDFYNCSKTDDYVPRPAYRPVTKFEERGKKLGHKVYDLLFKRR